MNGCRIKLISHEKFKRLQTKQDLQSPPLYSGYPWHPCNIVRLQNRGFSDGAADCSLGGIQNGKRVTLFHLEPENSLKPGEQVKIWQALSKDAVELKKGGTPRGFITGGVVEEEESKELRSLLKDFMRRCGVWHVSTIWGRKNSQVLGFTNVIYNADKNTWYVNAQLAKEGHKDILTLADLQRTFTKIHLATGDWLQTAEGVYTAEDLSQNPFKKMGGHKVLTKLAQSVR